MGQTATQIKNAKHEAHLQRRRVARAAKTAERKLAARIAEGEEGGEVNPTALGVKTQDVAAATTPKKVKEARAHLSEAFDLMGGVRALVLWGKRNPTEFYRIWARLIPKEAAEESNRLPLEDLLGKLAQRAEQSVLEAATGIGEDLLAEGKRAAGLEDAMAAFERDEGALLQ